MSRAVLGRVGADAESADGRWSRRSVRGTGVRSTAALAVVTLTAVAAWTGFRALHNAPVDLPESVLGVAPWLGPAAGTLAGVATVVLGLRSVRSRVRVGLLFVGVFGSLATVVPSVTVPAAVALVGGGAVALVAGAATGRGWPGVVRRAVPSVLLAGVALSLGAAMGLLPPGFRSAGAALVLAGLAGSPALVRPGPGGWVLGALVAGGVLWAGATLPFVTGAVTLVAFGLVGTPLLLFAAGVGGCVATVTGALRRRGTTGRDERLRGVGAALVLLAGAPVTVPGATAVVLGIALLAGVGAGGDRR